MTDHRRPTWIKMRVDLHDDPKVVSLSKQYGESVPTIIGHLHRLWSWFTIFTDDGRCTDLTLDEIDSVLGLEGFCRECHEVGWLWKDKGVVFIHEWDKHMSIKGRKRAMAVVRKAKQTDNEKQEFATMPPEIAHNVIFMARWEEFRQHRIDLKKPMTVAAERNMYRKIMKKGGAVPAQWAIEAAEHSMRNGWQDLWHPADKAGKVKWEPPSVNAEDPESNAAAAEHRRAEEQDEVAHRAHIRETFARLPMPEVKRIVYAAIAEVKNKSGRDPDLIGKGLKWYEHNTVRNTAWRIFTEERASAETGENQDSRPS